MTVESMQAEVDEWIHERPIIDTSKSALEGILRKERIELGRAIISGDKNLIRVETGDVLFSQLASHTIPDQTFRFCEYMGFDPNEVFSETLRKNRIHYPPTFFDDISPFVDPNDAIACVRLFRTIYGDPDKLNDFWAKVDHAVHDQIVFYDLWTITKYFRRFILGTLRKISRRKNPALKAEANRLLDAGDWDIVPHKL